MSPEVAALVDAVKSAQADAFAAMKLLEDRQTARDEAKLSYMMACRKLQDAERELILAVKDGAMTEAMFVAEMDHRLGD